MQKYALVVEYKGCNYHGWQLQPGVPTLQKELENSLSRVANQPVEVSCSGRTDTGVHGLGQVVHCYLPYRKNKDAWVLGVNRYLPRSMRVLHSYEVPDDFDARRSALSRHYCYLIYNHRVRPALQHGSVGWYYKPIDVQKANEAAVHLLGEHDFSSFRGADCQSLSPVRDVRYINVRREGDYVMVDIEANAFLHHMVRNIVGTLVDLSSSEDRSPDHMKLILEEKDRTKAGHMAQSSGLYFVSVKYPDRFGVPYISKPAWFVENKINELV